jgi:hypothetical protein
MFTVEIMTYDLININFIKTTKYKDVTRFELTSIMSIFWNWIKYGHNGCGQYLKTVHSRFDGSNL